METGIRMAGQYIDIKTRINTLETNFKNMSSWGEKFIQSVSNTHQVEQKVCEVDEKGEKIEEAKKQVNQLSSVNSRDTFFSSNNLTKTLGDQIFNSIMPQTMIRSTQLSNLNLSNAVAGTSIIRANVVLPSLEINTLVLNRSSLSTPSFHSHSTALSSHELLGNSPGILRFNAPHSQLFSQAQTLRHAKQSVNELFNLDSKHQLR